jgi:hypothetical protein
VHHTRCEQAYHSRAEVNNRILQSNETMDKSPKWDLSNDTPTNLQKGTRHHFIGREQKTKKQRKEEVRMATEVQEQEWQWQPSQKSRPT